MQRYEFGVDVDMSWLTQFRARVQQTQAGVIAGNANSAENDNHLNIAHKQGD